MLGTNPGVPLTLKVLIVDQSGVATVVVLFIVALDSLQITIRVDVRGENEDARRMRVAEVCGGGDREGPDGDGVTDTECVSSECDWNSEQLLFLFLVCACLDDMRDGTRIEPKGVAPVGKRDMIWV